MFKKFWKVSLLDLLEVELNSQLIYLLQEEKLKMITIDLNNNSELLSEYSKDLLKKLELIIQILELIWIQKSLIY